MSTSKFDKEHRRGYAAAMVWLETAGSPIIISCLNELFTEYRNSAMDDAYDYGYCAAILETGKDRGFHYDNITDSFLSVGIVCKLIEKKFAESDRIFEGRPSYWGVVQSDDVLFRGKFSDCWVYLIEYFGELQVKELGEKHIKIKRVA